MNAFTRHDVNRDPPSSGQLQAQAARSMAFLSAIETTVQSLTTDASLMASIAGEMQALLDRLHSDVATQLDPDGRVGDILSRAAAAAHRIYDDGIKRRTDAREDGELTQEDGVEDAFTTYIAAAADLHNVLENLRDAVETIDALRSPSTGKRYTSVDDMLSDLGS